MCSVQDMEKYLLRKIPSVLDEVLMKPSHLTTKFSQRFLSSRQLQVLFVNLGLDFQMH